MREGTSVAEKVGRAALSLLMLIHLIWLLTPSLHIFTYYNFSMEKNLSRWTRSLEWELQTSTQACQRWDRGEQASLLPFIWGAAGARVPF